VVEAKLVLSWSPLQISRWLAWAYPGDEEMRVSHETIYQSLFIQYFPIGTDLSTHSQRHTRIS
jgi:IS30 family transposase